MIETEGPPHDRTFHVEVRWHETSIRGTGASIKTAEMDAARRALEEIEELSVADVEDAESQSPGGVGA
jgi:dsRNA-specific ribonuclease